MLSPFIPPIINGIQDTLKPAGYLSFVLNTYEDPKIEFESIKALNNRQIDGIIFVAAWNDFMGPLLYLNSPEKFTVSLGLAPSGA